MKPFKKPVGRLADWICALALGAVAAVAYFFFCAGYVFPGESARLTVLWKGLDTALATPHPLMAAFARMFGCSNFIAPALGVILVIAAYHLMNFFFREQIGGEFYEKRDVIVSRFAALGAGVMLIFTPAVREAATHLTPALFVGTWALLGAAAFIPYARSGVRMGYVWILAIGVLFGLGLVESPVFLLLYPLFLLGITVVELKRGHKAYVPLAFFHLFLLIAFMTAFFGFGCATDAYLKLFAEQLKGLFSVGGSSECCVKVAVVVFLPFAAAIFSSGRSLQGLGKWTDWIFHLSMSVLVILAVATPLSPSEVWRPFGRLPVLASVFGAFVAGYLICYWWLHAAVRARTAAMLDGSVAASDGVGRTVAIVAGSVLSLTVLFSLVFNAIDFDGDRGAFADKIAQRIIAQLGERRWFVTDGRLDDHLRLAAAKSGRELNLICLQRDLDETYLDGLSKLVREKKVGGAQNADLLLSLKLGVVPFIQDWFASDPEIARKVAVFGTPDLWYSAKIKAIPEAFFFGGDPKVKTDWPAVWKETEKILPAPSDWGSYLLYKVADPVERLRLGLRRHVGLLVNDSAVLLQDEKNDDGAFALYDLVRESIDKDNISALINEFEMARNGYKKAVDRRKDFDEQLRLIVADERRRYVVWALANYYGYIRSPEIFVKMGFSWARSGRPGDALNNIRRALNIASEDRKTVLMNMMASLYASDEQTDQSRAMYQQVLAKNNANHDALIGMMRLALKDGDIAKASEYLMRAAEASGDEPVADLERGMLAMMKNDSQGAKTFLKKVTDRDKGNLQAWSLYATVLMQQFDGSKDQKERDLYLRELVSVVLPTMENQAKKPNDYYLQTTRAFVLLRQGDENRRAARDALVSAMSSRKDISSTKDMLLSLDISLNDTVEAERHAREALSRNRKDPLANYVMGSLALRDGKYDEAERYLRRSADAQRPVVLAMNDLAEVLRRSKRFDEAERYARMAVKTAPTLYVAWETIGAILMDRNRTGEARKRDLEEAETCVQKACELSRDKNGRGTDIRMLVSLARVQLAKGNKRAARATLGKVEKRKDELSEYELKDFEELEKRVR